MTLPKQAKKHHFATHIHRISRIVARVESSLRRNRRFAQQLCKLNDLPAALDSGVACIAVMKNEFQRIDGFLNHYRSLGVSGFVLIDKRVNRWLA